MVVCRFSAYLLCFSFLGPKKTSFSIIFSNSCFATVRFIRHQCVEFVFPRPRIWFVFRLLNFSNTRIFQFPTRYLESFQTTLKISPHIQHQKNPTDTKSGEWDIYFHNSQFPSRGKSALSLQMFKMSIRREKSLKIGRLSLSYSKILGEQKDPKSSMQSENRCSKCGKGF